MNFIFKIPLVRSLQRRKMLFPGAVLFVVVIVLIHGAFQGKPPEEMLDIKEDEVDTSFRSPVRPDVDKTILVYESDFWLQLAQEARNKIELISSKNIPAVYITPNLAVASSEALEQLIRDDQIQRILERFTAGHSQEVERKNEPLQGNSAASLPSVDGNESGRIDHESGLRLVAVDIDLGLALFELHGPAQTHFTLVNASRLPPGSAVAAITVESDKRLTISPGYLVSSEKISTTEEGSRTFGVSFYLDEMPATVAIVDVDGNLLGLALSSPSGTQILSAPKVLQVANRLMEQPLCYGIEVADLKASTAKVLGLRNGVFVEHVFAQSFKPSPSIRAGDVILRWAGENIQDSEQFYALYESQPPGSLVRYVVSRASRRIAGGTVMPSRDCRPISEPPLLLTNMGLVLEWNEQPLEQGDSTTMWRVATVVESTTASAAEFMIGDEVISINGRPLNRRNAKGIISFFESQNRPIALAFKRGDRVKLVEIVLGEVNR